MGTIPCVRRENTAQPQRGSGRDLRGKEGSDGAQKWVIDSSDGVATHFLCGPAAVGPAHRGGGRGDTTGQGNGSDE